MIAIKALAALPEWTEQTPRSGLDPLGMQVGSIGLYQTLLPGISNVTNRLRYYGLYVWLAEHHARHSGSTALNDWQRTIRRAEALYALTAAVEDGEYGMAGNRWARRQINELSGKTIDFAAATETKGNDLYLKQPWGAFGAAYRSQLFETELLERSDDHAIPLASETCGRALAEAFEEAVGDAGDRFLSIMESGVATLDDLARLEPMLPGEIDPTGAERDAYQALLFETNPSRAASLRLILRIAGEEGGIPAPDDVRWALYAESEGWGDLSETRRRWFVYHVDDLAHAALEGLLKLVLDTLGENSRGMETARLVAECGDAVMAAFDPAPETWHALKTLTSPVDDPLDDDDPSSDVSLAMTLQAAGRDGSKRATGTTGVAALRLLATLHRRIETEGVDARAVLGGSARSVVTELAFLDAHEDRPMREMLDHLIGERVIGRHLQVALGKLRYQGDHTFLFEADEGRLRPRGLDGPTFTNPRLGPAITFLQDIHLLDEDGPTDKGRALS